MSSYPNFTFIGDSNAPVKIVVFSQMSRMLQRNIPMSFRCLGSACEVLTTEAATIKNLIDGEQGDMGLLCQHIETVCEAVENNLKSARRRVPREFLTASSPNEANLGLDKDWYEQIATCYQHATKLMRTLQDLRKTALQTILTSGGEFMCTFDSESNVSLDYKRIMICADLDTGLGAAKLKEMAANSTEKIYDADDIGAIATIKASLAVIQKAAVNLSEKMAECENELAMSGTAHRKQENSEENSPIFLRAQATRKELEETKVLSRLAIRVIASCHLSSFFIFLENLIKCEKFCSTLKETRGER